MSPPGPIGGDDGTEAHPGDMAQRITRRRTELGQSIEEVAEKAGVDPGYLRYFEESAEGRLSAGTVLLLASRSSAAPRTSTAAGDPPAGPGPGGPASRVAGAHGGAVRGAREGRRRREGRVPVARGVRWRIPSTSLSVRAT